MSKRNRNRVTTIWDLGRVPLTPVAQPTGDAVPAGTLKQFREREDRKAREAEVARQAEIERVQRDSSRLMAECLSVSAPLQSKFWSSSFENLKAHLHDDDVFDNLFLPTSEDTVDSNAIYDVVQQFLDGVIFEQGYSLGDTSRRRFGFYVASQVNAGVVVNPASLAVMFKRCFELSIFKNDGDSEFIEHFRAKTPVKQPRVEPVEQPRQVTYADLESVDESTREGRREANRISEKLYEQQAGPILHKWCDSLEAFGFRPTMEDISGPIQDWFTRNNKSWIDPRSYDEVRRYMVSSGRWPEACLTEMEKFTLSLEACDLAHLTHEQRRTIAIREKLAKDADIKRFGHL
jgi:hypothetical protein